MIDIESLPLEDFCRALLDEAPKTSARELAAAWTEVHGETLPRARFKRIRDEWAALRKAGGTETPVDVDPAGDLPTLEALHHQLERAAQVGDSRACVAYANAIKSITGLGGPGPDETGGDWGRLSRPEAECLAALVVKANAGAQDATGLRWIGWVAKAPPVPAAVHPARIPLPAPAGSGKV